MCGTRQNVLSREMVCQRGGSVLVLQANDTILLIFFIEKTTIAHTIRAVIS